MSKQHHPDYGGAPVWAAADGPCQPSGFTLWQPSLLPLCCQQQGLHIADRWEENFLTYSAVVKDWLYCTVWILTLKMSGVQAPPPAVTLWWLVRITCRTQTRTSWSEKVKSGKYQQTWINFVYIWLHQSKWKVMSCPKAKIIRMNHYLKHRTGL